MGEKKEAGLGFKSPPHTLGRRVAQLVQEDEDDNPTLDDIRRFSPIVGSGASLNSSLFKRLRL